MINEKDLLEYENIGRKIKRSDKYTYVDAARIEDQGTRLYDVNGTRLPSVTTILGATKDQQFLKDWKAKVGEREAERIKNLSSSRGTAMHKFLEHYITGSGYDDLTEIGQKAKTMAEKVIEVGLAPVKEWYGSEVTLYYPGLYAGSTDLVCLHNGKESIVDFKQSNRPKRKEWVEDYYLQLVAYSEAHNKQYGTQIKNGRMFICTQANEYQSFEIENYDYWVDQWFRKLEQYYKSVL